MIANKLLLHHKYVRVIQLFAAQAGIPLREALDRFYLSEIHDEMEQGVSDMHCRSDGYLAEELQLEMSQSKSG
ncbi:MAG: DUF3791 domain-containing protein [Clostridiales Family XIII bacterium]|jgi:hypothetical protein|nr:DUF3791 domain-containing protein [Clostridiales Family XIII bacterium]